MNALLLIGSPKPGVSASRSFGEAMLARLTARGAQARTSRVTPAFRSPEAMDRLLDDVAWADLVILSCPLYVDTLPAPVIRLLETWHERSCRAADTTGKRVRMALLVQAGFPEARQNGPAIEVCEEFCRQSGVDWAGALAVGCGGALAGRPLERSPLAKAAAAIDRAADALAAGQAIPADAVQAVGRQFAPAWGYTTLGNLSWWWQARRRGAREPLRLRRYPQ